MPWNTRPCRGERSSHPVRAGPRSIGKALDKRLREARAELARVQADYGQKAAENPERVRRTMRGFKIAHGALGRALRAAKAKVTKLEAQRAHVPARGAVAEAIKSDVVKLAPERKLLSNLLKMVAYQAESDLVRLIGPHYKRAEDEGRTLIQNALASAADLEVTDTMLRVVLAPLSSAHRTRAVAAVCEELTRTETAFPGTRLRLHYAVAEPR